MTNILKKIGLSLLVASSLYGATPTTINFQGFLKDSNGDAITASKSIVFSLYTVSSGGANIWTSTKTVTVTDGVYSTVLGDTAVLTGLDFDAQYYLGINVAGDGEMTPRQALTSTAYAIKAKQLDVAYTLPAADGTSGQVLKTDGSGAATWENAGGFTITQYSNTGTYTGDGSFNPTSGVVATCTTGTIVGGGCRVISSTKGVPVWGYVSMNAPASTTTWECRGTDMSDASVVMKATAICIE